MTSDGGTPPRVGSGRAAQPCASESAALREGKLPQEGAAADDGGFKGYEWAERPVHWETPTWQCTRCHLWFVLEAFPANPRKTSGVSSWCRGCHLARKRQWREENRDYVEAYNAGRREGPFPAKCADCGVEFDAVRRIQVRCPVCQLERRRKR